MADREALIELAKRKKEEARQKILIARRDAEDRKSRLKNPPPQLVAMPSPTGDAEKDSIAELDAVQSGFRQRAKEEAKRFELATDSEYWCCLCFQTREQKEALLAALNLLQYGDKYIDGVRAANELGIKLPSADIAYNTGDKKADPKWLEFVK